VLEKKAYDVIKNKLISILEAADYYAGMQFVYFNTQLHETQQGSACILHSTGLFINKQV